MSRWSHLVLIVAVSLGLLLAILNAIAADRPGVKFVHGSLAIVLALVVVRVTLSYRRRTDEEE